MTRDLTTVLDEIQGRVDEVLSAPPVNRAALGYQVAAGLAVARQAHRLLAAVRSVLELHVPADEPRQGYTASGYGYIEPACAGCEASDEYAVQWPCPTVRYLTSALTGEVGSRGE